MVRVGSESLTLRATCFLHHFLRLSPQTLIGGCIVSSEFIFLLTLIPAGYFVLAELFPIDARLGKVAKKTFEHMRTFRGRISQLSFLLAAISVVWYILSIHADTIVVLAEIITLIGVPYWLYSKYRGNTIKDIRGFISKSKKLASWNDRSEDHLPERMKYWEVEDLHRAPLHTLFTIRRNLSKYYEWHIEELEKTW